jgi:hypothetical protein
MTTTGTGTSFPAALRHLADYTATTAVATGVELARATTDTLARPYRRRTPLDAASGALRWLTAVSDRRPPGWHTPNRITFSTPFAHLRDLTAPQHRSDDVLPTLVLPPQAGHSSHIVDYSAEQSQVGAIAAAGLTRLHVLEWRSATPATRQVTITDYVDVVDRSVQLLGGRVNLATARAAGWPPSTRPCTPTACTRSRWPGRPSTSTPATR